jgi:hypothetical protein
VSRYVVDGLSQASGGCLPASRAFSSPSSSSWGASGLFGDGAVALGEATDPLQGPRRRSAPSMAVRHGLLDQSDVII